MRALLSSAALAALFAALSLGGCGSSSAPAPDAGTDAGTDAGPVDSGPPDLDAGGCYSNPQTSFEIINACTDAGRLDKRPTLPLLLPDGGLPALP